MKLKWIYWVATGLLSLIYLAGGAYYLSDLAGVQRIFPTLGYPPYLVPILAVLKPLAAVTILWRFNVALSDLAYAGMFYHLLLAISAHLNAGDYGFAPALIGLTALLVSFATQNAARRKPSPYGQLFKVAEPA
ncbi:DoxX family protein [Agrobacterium larrymoorei]|uniref:DoxX family protein n=1 Tax=Agrobacterium larrymoorei TaxID=160699 RepID=A0A4D7DVE3_9HYPH|nr:DoxX family protein [Agrobacterium larrymoorei]QCJ01042.1 DoxX family protein [Agrobacterium larrymoorei]QYA10378.1 DoxX family protein [Agrobacterium larrymoorei]